MRAVVLAAALAFGCQPRDGVNMSKLPAGPVAEGYAVFAERCSRCHPLGRALVAPIETQPAWRIVVQRMKATSGSNISADDERAIMVFLSHLGEERRRAKAENREADL